MAVRRARPSLSRDRQRERRHGKWKSESARAVRRSRAKCGRFPRTWRGQTSPSQPVPWTSCTRRLAWPCNRPWASARRSRRPTMENWTRPSQAAAKLQEPADGKEVRSRVPVFILSPARADPRIVDCSAPYFVKLNTSSSITTRSSGRVSRSALSVAYTFSMAARSRSRENADTVCPTCSARSRHMRIPFLAQ